MYNRAIFATSGASTGFSAAALWEWARTPSAASSLAFVGSVASTLVGWYLARRAELRERDRQDRFLDAVVNLKIRQLESGPAAAAADGRTTPNASPP